MYILGIILNLAAFVLAINYVKKGKISKAALV
jgi:hypothetical protein